MPRSNNSEPLLMDFRVEGPLGRLFEDLRLTAGVPDLKALAHSVVTAFTREPGVRGVVFAVNPDCAALLDSRWNGRRLCCLVGNPDQDHPTWAFPELSWPENLPAEDLYWGSGQPPVNVSWQGKLVFNQSSSREGDWACFQVNTRQNSALLISLSYSDSLASHPEWGQDAVRMQQALQLVADAWVQNSGLEAGIDQLNNEKNALSRLNRLQGRFVGMASHEFKTPLTSITAYADALLSQTDEEASPTSAEFLGVIRTEAGRLLRMVNRILDFSRMEYGLRLLGGKPHQLGPLVEETLKILQPTILDKRQVCTLEPAGHLPRATVDADLIRQVLVNLIGNAVKFTPEGGSITISLTEGEAMIEVGIADTGPGIPLHDIHRIFREFYRSRETASRQEGTGLGLTIVRHIVNLHGGVVEARQRLGGGSVFTFKVPKEIMELGPLPAQCTSRVEEAEARNLINTVLQLMAEMAQVKTVSMLLKDANDQWQPVAGLGLSETAGNGGGHLPASGWQKIVSAGEASLASDHPQLDWSWHPANQAEISQTMVAPLNNPLGCDGCLVLANSTVNEEFGPQQLDQVTTLARVAGCALSILDADHPGHNGLSHSAQVAKTIEALRSLMSIRRGGVPTAAVDAQHLVKLLAQEMGLDAGEISDLQYAAALHDAGMARVEDEILLGETELSFDERDEVDRHVEQGLDLMSPLLPNHRVGEMIRQHHERFDGSGYPEGLKGSNIQQGARLLAVIDAWFSLTMGRSFRPGLPRAEAMTEIRENADTQFDRKVVEALGRVLEKQGVISSRPLQPGSV